ncbi:hypothetical protein [Amycolatopsis sp. cmx-4-83]|uniref:hypothetical protein n=1 Tax=Amycolatopsis sp. cmx-4-83 TaxID=2790940 RepID=UPI003977F041
MTDHFAEAEAWLASGEQAYEQFESDEAPRDVSLLRRAETAARFAEAHVALGWAQPKVIRFTVPAADPDVDLAPGRLLTYPAPSGQPIPVSPVHPDGRT